VIQFLNRKDNKLPWCCGLFFALWQMLVIVHYKGWYAFDETYHLFASNDFFKSISSYDRAPYINETIAWLTHMFGKSYYIYKLIPYIVSVISIGIMLYVLYHYIAHNYSMLLFTIMVSFHTVVLFNHIYIRMYVFDELMVSILVLIFFLLSKTNSKLKKAILSVIYITASVLLFLFCTWEGSSKVLIIIAAGAYVGNGLGKFLINYCVNRNKQLILLIAFMSLLTVLMAFIIGYKAGLIKLSFAIPMVDMGVGYPWLFRHFYHGNIALLLALAIVGVRLIYNRYSIDSNIVGIYLLAFLSFVIYILVYFDAFFLRVFASYMVVMIFVAVFWADSLETSRINAGIIVLLFGYNLLHSQSDIDFKEYIEAPYIQWESGLNNYDGLIDRTTGLIDEGRMCICIWNSYNDAALYSELYDIADENYCLVDDCNMNTGEVTVEILDDILDRMSTTSKKYVIMIAPHVDSLLEDEADQNSPTYVGYIDKLKETFPREEFKANSFSGIFLVN